MAARKVLFCLCPLLDYGRGVYANYTIMQARTRPIVRPTTFRDIKCEVFPSSDDAEDPMPDEAGDEWLDEPLEIPGDDVPRIQPVADSFVNLRAELLRDLLADSEDTAANAMSANTKQTKERSGGFKGDGDDNNYGVTF